MQPTCRQVPPRKPSFSMTKVFSPHCAARIAVLYPPGPLPIIARSYLAKCPPRQAGAPLVQQQFGCGLNFMLNASSESWGPPNHVEKQPASPMESGLALKFRETILSAAPKRRNRPCTLVVTQFGPGESEQMPAPRAGGLYKSN